MKIFNGLNRLLAISLLMGYAMLAAAKDKNNEAPILVEVAPVKQATIPKQVNALGNLVAIQYVTISSEVAGRVAKIFFQDGQEVAAGMPIIQLDNAQDKANYDSAVTALNLSETKYNRGLLLAKQGAIAQQDLDQLKANVEKGRADVKSSQAALNQKELTAPFSGILGAFQVQVGDFIDKGTALVTLVNKDQLKVEYSLPENLLSELALGQQVEVVTGAYPNQQFTGTVTFISPTVNPVNRSIGIQAIIQNKQNLLSPGMFVDVTQNIAIDTNALVIPEQAITASVQGYSVFKVVNGKAVLASVTLGVRRNGDAQILSGLAKGDVVVIAGQQKLQDGSAVQIMTNGI